MKLKTVILEDEADNVFLLKHFLLKYCPDIEILTILENVNDAIDFINKHSPDLLILDIMLENGTAFDVLDKLTISDYQVVFTTAHDDFAIKAFKYNAIDYLLKPIQIDALLDAIERVRKRIVDESYYSRINALQKLHASSNTELIAIPTGDKIEFIKSKDILFIKSDGKYSEFHTINNSFIVSSRNLGEYESYLDSSIFFRCHNSFIVNLNFVKSIDKVNGFFFEMNKGIKIPISRRKKNELQQRFNL
ncbi:LytTR family DNA-binding domain-containing protein [Fluviicola taffensis]|uniref:LytR/AlgR family response regulator transcription factor n=1 Tax=Fluviicola taffensis TaxID=191579 RepID=UPI003137A882